MPLSPEDLTGATVTVTSLSGTGAHQVPPISRFDEVKRLLEFRRLLIDAAPVALPQIKLAHSSVSVLR